MALQVTALPKERDGVLLRKALHHAADELADMYEAGHPMGMYRPTYLASTKHGDLKIEIYVSDWI